MKKKRFNRVADDWSVEAVTGGSACAEVIRRPGISEQTFYRWKSKYTGFEVDQVHQMAQLQEEDQRLKRLMADLTLDKTMLRMCFQKSGDAFAAWTDSRGVGEGVLAGYSGPVNNGPGLFWRHKALFIGLAERHLGHKVQVDSLKACGGQSSLKLLAKTTL